MDPRRPRITQIQVGGYKSFPPVGQAESPSANGAVDSGAMVTLGDLTVLLGANGSGKTNFVSLFKLLDALNRGRLKEFVGQSGGARSLLHFGKASPRMAVSIEFDNPSGSRCGYRFELVFSAPDALTFSEEQVRADTVEIRQPWRDLGYGHAESKLPELGAAGIGPGWVVHTVLDRCRPYQFHDTSPMAPIRLGGYVEDTQTLLPDGGNLAAFLLGLRVQHPEHYQVVRDTVRQVCPDFDDWDLRPSDLNSNTVLLNWRSRSHPDYLLGPHQLSDGTLRFMALAGLFLQPSERMPAVVVVDEPELGLHPYAIGVLATIASRASHHCQVLLATQSPTLVDYLGLDQICLLENREGRSAFRRLDPSDWDVWLESYSTGQLWQREFLGGIPIHA